ncbi:MAG: triose-phosphate isomerase [Rhodospirillales bacterium]|nr:triose-phosphate isomerase [Rhodospirillales bacterium]
MTVTPRPLIAGNWKMNGLREDGLALARALAERVRSTGDAGFDMLVCPPFTLLAEIGLAIDGSGIALGAQDCHQEQQGAHTGDVSAAMLNDMGCRYAIVGHSERRSDHAETDAVVESKAGAAHRQGLVAIVCVGETGDERDSGATLSVVTRQLAGSLPDGASASNTVIAYEPVWAIGTGRTPCPDDVAEVHALVRDRVAAKLGLGKGRGEGEAQARAMRILYGGSVNPSNAAELLTLDDVNGALVGGASLKADDFWSIAERSL